MHWVDDRSHLGKFSYIYSICNFPKNGKASNDPEGSLISGLEVVNTDKKNEIRSAKIGTFLRIYPL